MLKVANNMRSTNCSNTLRSIHTNARKNITRTRAKRKAGYFFVAHPVGSNYVIYFLRRAEITEV
jgi:hypothetical protein